MLRLESTEITGYLVYEAVALEAVQRYVKALSLPMAPGDSLVITLRDDIAPGQVTLEGDALPRAMTPITHVYTFRYHGTCWERLRWWWLRHTTRKEA
jgi:hypothetical protein